MGSNQAFYSRCSQKSTIVYLKFEKAESEQHNGEVGRDFLDHVDLCVINENNEWNSFTFHLFRKKGQSRRT